MRRKLPVVCLLLGIAVAAIAAENRGVTVMLRVGDRELPLYEESHALIIGASRYTAGWPSLPGVKRDVGLVKEALARQGFTTRVVLDPTRQQFDDAVTQFVADYGQQLQARLLIYFAGHGHTLTTGDGRQLGYILPVDTPRPSPATGPFKGYAVSMTYVETIATQLESKHVLFVFDSCFSGSIFDAARSIPDVISEKTARPVRQFITAGTAEQTVPDTSVFRGQFIDGINGEADANGDGYVTGSELGEFLQSKVTNYTRRAQTPEYGKISRVGLDKGDFVFDLGLRNVPGSPVVVRGRGLEITQSEFEAAMRMLRFDYATSEWRTDPRQFAAWYARTRLLAARGRAVGLAADGPSRQKLQAHLDNEVGVAMVRRIGNEEGAVKATEEALRAYYRAHGDEFIQVEGRVIALGFKPGLPESEVEAKAERLRRELAAGADFATIAKRESEDEETAPSGGRLPPLRCEEAMDEVDVKFCRETPIGAIRVLRIDDDGYAIFRLDRRTTAPFEAVREEIIGKERNRRVDARIASIAKANGPIADAELMAAATNLRGDESGQPADPKLDPGYLDYMRTNIALAKAGYAAGIDREPALALELRIRADKFVANAERDQMRRGIVITEQELDRYYREHQPEFELVWVRSIRIPFKGSLGGGDGPLPSKTEARAKAERIRNEILAGAAFEKVATTENAATGGGSIMRGEQLREIENAAFSTPAGKVAPVTETMLGYEVLLVDERAILPLEKARPKIDEILRNQKLQVLVDALAGSAELYFDPVYFASR